MQLQLKALEKFHGNYMGIEENKATGMIFSILAKHE